MQGYQTEKLSTAVNNLSNSKQLYIKTGQQSIQQPRLRGLVEDLGALLKMQSSTTAYMSFSVIYFPVLQTCTQKQKNQDLVNKWNCTVPSPATTPKFLLIEKKRVKVKVKVKRFFCFLAINLLQQELNRSIRRERCDASFSIDSLCIKIEKKR